MSYTFDKKSVKKSQALRKNMTSEERKLWYEFFKNLPFPIKRQKPIGKYIVDFYCAEMRTVIELDGSQHFEQKGAEYDTARDGFLRDLGITVLRYSNRDVNTNFKGVCDDILHKLNLI